MIYPQNFEQKIGFDEIRTLLMGHCLSTLGIERVGQMKFLTDLHLLRELQEQTREFLRIQRTFRSRTSMMYARPSNASE